MDIRVSPSPTPFTAGSVQTNFSVHRPNQSAPTGTDIGLSEDRFDSFPEIEGRDQMDALRKYATSQTGASKDCKLKPDPSPELAKRLLSIGVEAREFSKLKEPQRKNLLNILARTENAGISLDGLQVARKKDGKLNLNKERVFFTARSPEEFQALEKNVKGSEFSTNKSPEHNGMRESYRQKVKKNSLQIGFGKDGKTVEIDIDPNNPQGGFVPWLKHFKNVLFDGKTNPNKVRDERYWETECP